LASTSETGKELLVPDLAPAKYKPLHYQFIMPEDQQRRILREAPQLRMGDTVDEVVARLGPPLSDNLLSAKVWSGSAPTTRALHYYFAMRDLNLVSESDPIIAIYFDAQNRLDSLASDIPGIPDINWPPGATTQPDKQEKQQPRN
jgi:hypothetical protein